MNNVLIFYCYDPLPNLPPGGKEHFGEPFPLGGNEKGGYLKFNGNSI
jgi:hypothetical protein